MRTAMGPDSPDYKEATAAIDSVSRRVTQEIVQAERRKWNQELESVRRRQTGQPQPVAGTSNHRTGNRRIRGPNNDGMIINLVKLLSRKR